MWTREDEGLDGFAMLEVEGASRPGSSGDHVANVDWLFENSITDVWEATDRPMAAFVKDTNWKGGGSEV